MAIREILRLGNPRLYEKSLEVRRSELDEIRIVAADLHDTMIDFRRRHGFGKAIAAPQIGIMKRLVSMNVDGPVTFVNPVLHDMSDESFGDTRFAL